jgi:antitoxin CptB
MTEPDHLSPSAPHDLAPGAARDTASDLRRRRLLFRATHRGTFENDLMIGGFVRAHVASLTETDVDALELVMELPDTDLADWLTGRVPIPLEEETPMLRRMRDFLAR